VQPGEREPGLFLDPGGPYDMETAGLLGGLRQQRGLTDAGIAAQHKRAAGSVPGLAE
jgi:hypothetical protein